MEYTWQMGVLMHKWKKLEGDKKMTENRESISFEHPDSSQINHLPQSDSAIENLSFEQALTELEQIVSDLESGHYTLEEILNRYQRGQKLAQHCAHLLEQADIIVKQISIETGGESLSDLQ